MPCLSEEMLMRFVSGALSRRELAQLEAHLYHCTECRNVEKSVWQILSRSERAQWPSDPKALASDRPSSVRLLEDGATFGRYVIDRQIDRGAMGMVYEAHDPQLDRKVALKVLHRGTNTTAVTTDARARLFREAQAMAKLAHNNVVAVFDAGDQDGHLYLTMELHEGRTLRHWSREAIRSWRETCDVFLNAARGLAAAHQKGIIHRDFKPENVLIGWDGRVKVTDFGLARGVSQTDDDRDAAQRSPQPCDEKSTSTGFLGAPLHERLTRSGAVAGTPAYMAPEQWGGEGTELSDQYAFCVAFFEGLYGHRPFADRVPARDAPNSSQPVLVSQLRVAARVPRAIHRIVMRGLSSNPEARFASMEELANAIERYVTGREKRRVGLAMVIALGSLALVLVAVLRWKTATPPTNDREWFSNQIERRLKLATKEPKRRASLLNADLQELAALTPSDRDVHRDSLNGMNIGDGLRVVAPSEIYLGKSLPEWIPFWWAWHHQAPFREELKKDYDCARNLVGPVWIPSRTDTKSPLHQKCTIPSGTAILMMLGQGECSTAPDDTLVHDTVFGTSEKELSKCAIAWEVLSPVLSHEVTIDGAKIADIDQFLALSPRFSFSAREGNRFETPAGTYQSISYGRIVVVHPLSRGMHRLHILLIYGDGSVEDATFDLTVEDPPRADR